MTDIMMATELAQVAYAAFYDDTFFTEDDDWHGYLEEFIERNGWSGIDDPGLYKFLETHALYQYKKRLIDLTLADLESIMKAELAVEHDTGCCYEHQSYLAAQQIKRIRRNIKQAPKPGAKHE
jgi:hypothetical protein